MKKTILCVILCGLMIGCTNINSHHGQTSDIDIRQEAEALQDLRFGMFICWSFSTFSGYEWTWGVTDLGFFNPSGFDPDQWCRVAKEAGMGYILFLSKHHDGFCLWDTRTTGRKVTNSPLGVDVLAAVKKSCDKYGLKLALYFSEGEFGWRDDAEHKAHGGCGFYRFGVHPDLKKAQLKELLTRYGPIEFIWFDHAIGDGGLSHLDTIEWVKQFQPGCIVGFNHGDQRGAEIRIGERGKPGPLDDHTAAGPHQKNTEGNRYMLAEFTYPILPFSRERRGARWFYSLPENDGDCHTAEKIYADYCGAVKYGNIFSLAVAPGRDGKLRPIDIQTLQQVGQSIRGELKSPKQD